MTLIFICSTLTLLASVACAGLSAWLAFRAYQVSQLVDRRLDASIDEINLQLLTLKQLTTTASNIPSANTSLPWNQQKPTVYDFGPNSSVDEGTL